MPLAGKTEAKSGATSVGQLLVRLERQCQLTFGEVVSVCIGRSSVDFLETFDPSCQHDSRTVGMTDFLASSVTAETSDADPMTIPAVWMSTPSQSLARVSSSLRSPSLKPASHLL